MLDRGIRHPHLQYAVDIVNGSIVSSRNVFLQCRRTLAEHEKGVVVQEQWGERYEWVYDPSKVQGKINFIQDCPYPSGRKWAGKTIELTPWQLFFISEVYGWVSRVDSNVRRYREAILFVARKNGKTTLCSTLGLYEAAFGDHGAEAYIASTKKEQSDILWEISQTMVNNMIPELAAKFKITAKEISTDRGKLKSLSNKSKTQDGLNPSLAIIDEAAAVTDSNQIHVIESGMGSRDSPLMLFITTAQPMRFTLFRSRYELARRGLQSGKMPKSTFAMLYELDDEEEIDDHECWIKANPNLGVSVSKRQLGEALEKCRDNPREKGLTLCKHFNIWAQGETAWIPIELWDKCAVKDIKREGSAYIGLDLAQNRDLAAAAILWDHGGDRYALDWQFWTPASSLDSYPPDDRAVLDTAVDCGVLKLLDEEFVDERYIYEWVKEQCVKHTVKRIGTDPYFAKKLTSLLEQEGLPVLNIPQSPAMLSDPIKRFENLVLGENLTHPGYVILQWMVMNVLVNTRPSEGITLEKPRSEPFRKIDGLDAAVNCVACVEFSEGGGSFSDMDLEDADEPEEGPGLRLITSLPEDRDEDYE